MKSLNRSTPNIYEEFENSIHINSNEEHAAAAAAGMAYFQNLRRNDGHHQVVMIFVIGGITHSEIK